MCIRRECPSLYSTQKESSMDKTEYQKLKDIVEGIAADYDKAVAGNRAAATRVRKAMQEVKATAQNIRTGILSDVKKEG